MDEAFQNLVREIRRYNKEQTIGRPGAPGVGGPQDMQKFQEGKDGKGCKGCCVVM